MAGDFLDLALSENPKTAQPLTHQDFTFTFMGETEDKRQLLLPPGLAEFSKSSLQLRILERVPHALCRGCGRISRTRHKLFCPRRVGEDPLLLWWRGGEVSL